MNHLRYSVAVGTEKERREALRKSASLYIINRENVPWLVEKTNFSYDAIVIDELSSFKNWSSERFKALMEVRPLTSRVIGLTGTPPGNGLMDLFAEFKVLDMGQHLGRFITKYQQDYFTPDKRNGQMMFSYAPLPGDEERIYEKIADITISMKAADHLRMLELIESAYSIRMNESEKKIVCQDVRAVGLADEGRRGDGCKRWCPVRDMDSTFKAAVRPWYYGSFGLTWSLELYQQTVARLYRQGQSAKTVVVQHIIAEGTIDE